MDKGGGDEEGVMETVVLLVMWMEMAVMIMVTIRIEMTTVV